MSDSLHFMNHAVFTPFPPVKNRAGILARAAIRFIRVGWPGAASSRPMLSRGHRVVAPRQKLHTVAVCPNPLCGCSIDADPKVAAPLFSSITSSIAGLAMNQIPLFAPVFAPAAGARS
ncbi:hypothetical protein [Herbaspirillum sp.]|uniref:hypothetical protein n=1 Tax=Herbaspirillum sp. TaxID=1890675 RepID=UPI001B1F2209|nr:hypothetical protein [Herbaspirillum sp.]MBO9536983.1 hypothetical protein [Herbaspirillum sp.]